jgi:hypothetical protein
MEINKIKEINNVYDTINYALIDIEKEIEPFELYLNSQIFYGKKNYIQILKFIELVITFIIFQEW